MHVRKTCGSSQRRHPSRGPRTPRVKPSSKMKRATVRFGDEDAGWLASFSSPCGAALPAHRRRVLRAHPRARGRARRLHRRGADRAAASDRSCAGWTRVCSGPYDEAYFEETAQDRPHARPGRPAAALHVHGDGADPRRARAHRRGDAGRRAPRGRARRSRRALDLELAIMLETLPRRPRRAQSQRVERARARRRSTARCARTEHRYATPSSSRASSSSGSTPSGTVRLFNREAERVTGLRPRRGRRAAFVDDAAAGRRSREEHGAAARARRGRARAPRRARERGPHARRARSATCAGSSRTRRPRRPDEVVLFAIGHDMTDENALAARVRQSEKLAAVGTLAAGLAHEIRNPLNGAQLHITFLERALKRAGVDDAGHARGVARRRRRDPAPRARWSPSSSTSRGPSRSMKKPTSRAGALRARRRSSSPPTPRPAGVALDADLPPPELVVDVDAAKIEQVLLNLLRNAVEALAPAGGGHGRSCARGGSRGTCVIEVEDDGPGPAEPRRANLRRVLLDEAAGHRARARHRPPHRHRPRRDHRRRAAGPGDTVFRFTLPAPAQRHRCRMIDMETQHEHEGPHPGGRRRGERAQRASRSSCGRRATTSTPPTDGDERARRRRRAPARRRRHRPQDARHGRHRAARASCASRTAICRSS